MLIEISTVTTRLITNERRRTQARSQRNGIMFFMGNEEHQGGYYRVSIHGAVGFNLGFCHLGQGIMSNYAC